MLKQEVSLLVIAIHIKLFFKSNNSLFLRNSHLIDCCPHPLKKGIDDLWILQLNGFGSLCKISFIIKFFPQLLTPLGKYSKDSWTLDD